MDAEVEYSFSFSNNPRLSSRVSGSASRHSMEFETRVEKTDNLSSQGVHSFKNCNQLVEPLSLKLIIYKHYR